MKKLKILAVALMLILSVSSLAGCKKKNEDNVNVSPEDVTNKVNMSSKEDDTDIKNIINDSEIKDNTNVSGDLVVSGDESGDEVPALGLSSTENRAVFNFGNVYYVIYDFEGEKISNFSYCYMYEDEVAGQAAYDYFVEILKNPEEIQDEAFKDIKEVKREGKYIIVSMKESTYSELTKQEVMDAYSYLEQIY